MGVETPANDEQVKRAQRTIPRWCCGGCLAPILLLLAIRFLWPVGCELFFMGMWNVDHVPFDSERWKQPVDDKVQSECIRGRMVRDLILHRTLDGLTRDETKELLGTPGEIGSHTRATRIEDLACPEVAIMRARRWQYYLGFCSGFQIDADLLVVEFGEDGRVRRYYTYQS